MAAPGVFTALAEGNHSEAPLPWEREMPLGKAAQSVTIEGTLHPNDPRPDFGGEPFNGPSMAVTNLKMRSTIWGPPDRITVSLNKNDVWDRRLHEFRVPTIQDLTDGAFAKLNENYTGIEGNSLRPKDLGWLWKEGGSHDPYRSPMRYAFPSLKPVGQIILAIDALAGAEAPRLSQSCADGVVSLHVANGNANARLHYVLGMTSNVYAVRGQLSGIEAPISLRLYRHRDTSHLVYMKPDGKTYTNPAAEADRAFNGPIDPPTSGTDGRYFWIRQRMPAEATFPLGFEYILMGVVIAPGKAQYNAVQDKTGLGTPPLNTPLPGDWKTTPRPPVADAPGAAATATFTPDETGKFEALVTVVTTSDGTDLPALAKKRLEQAGGFDGVVTENTAWWNAFYNMRENGRIFYGTCGTDCTEDIRALYRSYTDFHGGGTKTDMRHFEGSASYALPERDFQEWDSAPCYNEIFNTSRFVRNWADSEDMWKQIVWHWLPAAQENARHIFGLPGMFISHGYLPPVKPVRYVHTTITLELCLGTMAQIVRPAWDEWDYGGNIDMLREECYPLMRQMALFYAAYAKKERDGYYHIAPCMQEESWGVYPKFARNKDVISSLCMFRWALGRAAEAAELLNVDAEERQHWREIAAQIAPYPTWQRKEGLVFAEMPGLQPQRLPDDHFGDAASYPTVLADEINLDSPRELQKQIVRGVTTLPSGNTDQALLLLGIEPEKMREKADDPSNHQYVNDAEALLNSRSGRIHLFPLAAKAEEAGSGPASGELAFRNFQARGGFLVSACRNRREIYFVEIEARRGGRCRVMNPWPGSETVVRQAGNAASVPHQLNNANGECIEFLARTGCKYLLSKNS